MNMVVEMINPTIDEKVLDSSCGEHVIIMLKGQNTVSKRGSELPQSMKFENWFVA